MKIEQAIQQPLFKSEKEKAILNLMYTNSWLCMKQIRFFKQFGLSPQQYNVLRILKGQYPNSVSISIIQDRMLDKMSNASRLVDKLKKRELIERNECPKDRRQMDVILIQKGIDLLKEIEQHEEQLNGMMGPISKNEANTLNQLLDKLRN
jgi:DNA-binding MarR family transcriptional regulator